MKKYEHLREKALSFRDKGMSLGDICERLALKKTTVYYWIKDTGKIPATKNQSKSAIVAGKAAHKKFKELRDTAYNLGIEEYSNYSKDREFRDFIILYLTEGYRRNRNMVTIANSNDKIVCLSYRWIKKLANSERKMIFSLQCHVDNDENELKEYWAKKLNIESEKIRVIRKSNSGEMTGRNWRSQYGVFTVGVCDTYLRSRIQAWMDLIQKEWINNNGV